MEQIFGQTVVTQSEAAKELGVTAQTISTWLKKGILRGFKIGGRFWVVEASLRDAIQDARRTHHNGSMSVKI